jgi:hypothetical protein
METNLGIFSEFVKHQTSTIIENNTNNHKNKSGEYIEYNLLIPHPQPKWHQKEHHNPKVACLY